MLGYYNYTVILTYIGMLIGFRGILCAIGGQYQVAVLCLMGSGICDMFDGVIAATRTRDICEKNFGIQIDSLSDLICFGVLPAVIFYCMSEDCIISVVAGSVYLLCALIRLAYFNVEEAERQRQYTEPRLFYRGLPVTISALIIPILYLADGIFKIVTVKIYGTVLIGMAIAFLLPFKIKKPNLTGKICMLFCGCFELLFLLAGVYL